MGSQSQEARSQSAVDRVERHSRRQFARYAAQGAMRMPQAVPVAKAMYRMSLTRRTCWTNNGLMTSFLLSGTLLAKGARHCRVPFEHIDLLLIPTKLEIEPW